MSNEQKLFLKNIKKQKIKIYLTQFFLVMFFLILWELLSKYNIINSFIFSSPSRICKTIINLIQENNLFIHIFTTLYETIIAFILGILIGLLVAILLYLSKFLAKVLDPFLTLLNSLPKVALGPLIIIWIGANNKSIIFMALLINIIINIVTIYNGFMETDENKIKLMKTFKATKFQILCKLVIPSSRKIIISSLKLNISMSLIGLLPPVGEKLPSSKYCSKY